MHKVMGYLLFAGAVLLVVVIAFRVTAIKNLIMPPAKAA